MSLGMEGSELNVSSVTVISFAKVLIPSVVLSASSGALSRIGMAF